MSKNKAGKGIRRVSFVLCDFLLEFEYEFSEKKTIFFSNIFFPFSVAFHTIIISDEDEDRKPNQLSGVFEMAEKSDNLDTRNNVSEMKGDDSVAKIKTEADNVITISDEEYTEVKPRQLNICKPIVKRENLSRSSGVTKTEADDPIVTIGEDADDSITALHGEDDVSKVSKNSVYELNFNYGHL